jgi:hypothetical protein
MLMQKLMAHPGIHLADFINMFMGTRLLDLADQEHCPAEEATVPVDQARSSSFIFPESFSSNSFSFARAMFTTRSLASVGMAVRGLLSAAVSKNKSPPPETP